MKDYNPKPFLLTMYQDKEQEREEDEMSLNNVLKRLGYTVEDHSKDCCRFIKLKSIVKDGVSHHCGDAHTTWIWLNETGQHKSDYE